MVVVVPLVSIEAVARKNMRHAIQNLGICHHPLIIGPPLEGAVHLNYDPIWRLDALVIITVLFLVPGELYSLGDAIVPIFGRATEVSKHPINEANAVPERSAFRMDCRRKDRRHTLDAWHVHCEAEVVSEFVQMIQDHAKCSLEP